MEEVELDATLRAWGNSYGIIIPADVARRLGLKAGEPVHIHLSYERRRNDASKLPQLHIPFDFDIDEVMEEELLDKEKGWR